jgi:hypothetical protein
MLQGVHRRGRCQITRGYRECHKECVQRTLGIIEFVVEAKLRRDKDFKGIEGRQRFKVTSQRLTPEELTPSPLAWSH